MSKQEPESNDARETKRAQFAEPVKAKNKTTLILVAVLVAAIAAVAYVVMSESSDKPTVIAAPQQPNKQAEPDSPSGPVSELRVPIADVAGGRAKFFDYKLANNQQVRFFVVKSSAGDYRAALDACEVCAHAKQGYRQDGDDMVCNNCGKKFATALIGKISGGCHPVALTAATDGDNLVIKKSEIEAGKKYF